MKLESKNENGVLVLTLINKRLDAKLAVYFRKAVDDLIKTGHYTIALNMTHVEFIDSSGLGALVGCLKLAGSKGKFVLFGLQPTVVSMLKLTRMDRVFDLYAAEEQALQMLKRTDIN